MEIEGDGMGVTGDVMLQRYRANGSRCWTTHNAKTIFILGHDLNAGMIIFLREREYIDRGSPELKRLIEGPWC
jgi:hypothetical protein